MTPRRAALARAFPIVIVTVVFGALIVFLALRTARGIEQSEAEAARFEGLAERCEGPAQAAAEGEAPGLPGVAFRLVQGRWLYDDAILPAAWRAARAEDVRVVLCLGPAEALATTACRADASGVAPTRVYGEALTVRLVHAGSGALLAEQALHSATVSGCRDEQDVVRLGAEVIEGWVRQVVGQE